MTQFRPLFPAARPLLPLVLLLALAATLPACRGAGRAADPDQVVATWSGGEIRRRDLPPRLVERIEKEVAARPADKDAILRNLLGRWVRLEILHREALAAGLDARPDVAARLAAREAETLAKRWVEAHREPVKTDPARVSEETARREALAGIETRRFSNIFLRVPPGDAEALATARAKMAEIRREIDEGSSFEEMARTWSDSITARGGGRVEWTTREQLEDSVAASVFSLAEGEIGKPVETRDGVHLFRVDMIRRPATADREALARRVEEEMTEEATRVADDAARRRAFDEAGVEIDAAGLALPTPSAPPTVATWDGGTQRLTRADFDALRQSTVNVASDSPEAFARRIVTDRILAARQSAAGLDESAKSDVARVRRGELIAAAREERVRAVPIEIGPEDEKTFFEENVSTTGWMLARTVDVLFVEQKGGDVAAAYAAGEAVTKELRAGRSFEAVSGDRKGKPGWVVRTVTGVDADRVRLESPRVGKELDAAERGVPSPPVYVDAVPFRFGTPDPVTTAPGVLFFRVVDVKPRPLDELRPRIREALLELRRAEAVAAIKAKLDAQGNLQLVADAF